MLAPPPIPLVTPRWLHLMVVRFTNVIRSIIVGLDLPNVLQRFELNAKSLICRGGTGGPGESANDTFATMSRSSRPLQFMEDLLRKAVQLQCILENTLNCFCLGKDGCP